MSNPIIYCSSAENYFLTCIRSISFDLVFSFQCLHLWPRTTTDRIWRKQNERISVIELFSWTTIQLLLPFCSFYILFDWLASIEYKHSLYIRLTYSEVRWQVKTCNAAKIVRLYYFYTSELAYQLYLCKDIDINLTAIYLISIFEM